MSGKLPSYLRTLRKRHGLTQKDLAFLLDLASGASVSKLEKSGIVPSSRVFLAYCIIFDVHPRAVLPGLLRDIERAVNHRANALRCALRKQAQTKRSQRRLQFLDALTKE